MYVKTEWLATGGYFRDSVTEQAVYGTPFYYTVTENMPTGWSASMGCTVSNGLPIEALDRTASTMLDGGYATSPRELVPCPPG